MDTFTTLETILLQLQKDLKTGSKNDIFPMIIGRSLTYGVICHSLLKMH